MDETPAIIKNEMYKVIVVLFISMGQKGIDYTVHLFISVHERIDGHSLK